MPAKKKDDQPVVNDADQSVGAIADEEKARLERAKRREEAQPKKVKTLPVEERAGVAVVSADVPAHTAEVPVAKSSIPGVIAAAVEAWHAVKGKDDAEFALARPEFRQDLINHAEEVYRSGIVTEGDTVMARFEREISNIKLREADKAAKAA